MNVLISWLGGETCRNLMMALAHTLWQGLLIGGLLYAYLRAVPAEAARKRYAASAISLLIVVLAGLLTWSILNYTPAEPVAKAAQPSVTSTAAEQTSFVVTPSGVSLIESTPAVPQKPEAANATQWHTWATGLWLLGAAAMLLRAVGIMIAGGRLRRRCTPVQDETILTMVEQLRKTMRIGRKIRVLASEHISVPGVVGCLWPALLLPAAMISGTPTDDLKAIFAHELAHIRRFDYLVNFAQMVIEALLFFNPAVWWISRQMRIEREACCDVAGIALTGRKTQYAETLVTWAQKLRDQRIATAALVGFAGNNSEGPLLDRIRRIVVAGHRPHLRVSWPAAMGMLLLSGLALTALWQGAGAAVAFAGTILTPQQRIEAMTEIAEDYGYEDREYGEEDKVLVSGTVQTYDGNAVPTSARLTALSDCPRYSASASVRLTSEGQPVGVAAFSRRVEFGRVWLLAQAEGYEPAFAGPFDPEPGGTIEGLVLVLQKGFASSIRVIDEDGQPVEGAEVSGGYLYPQNKSYRYTITVATDHNGIATLEHASNHTAAIKVEADGFEPTKIENLHFKQDEPRDVILRATAPIAGTVLSSTGEPISGATARLLASCIDDRITSETDIRSAPDTITGSDGKFILARLEGTSTYLVLIQADGYKRQYLADVRPGDIDMKVTLDVEPVIRGVITGELQRLAINDDGAPYVQYRESYRYGNFRWIGSKETCPVRIEDGVGYFEIADFYGQTIEVDAGGKKVDLDIDTEDLDNIVIDLPPEITITRNVVLAFDVPADSPPAQGGVRIGYVPQDGRSHQSDWLDIIDGQAHCEVPVPCRFSYAIDYNQGKQPIGYWFKRANSIDIAVGDEPFVIEVPTYPAGSIYGRVLQPDGSVATNAWVSLMVATLPEVVGTGSDQFDLTDAIRGGPLDRGRFNAAPLPLGGEYTLIAHAGNNFRVIGPLALNQKNPIVEQDIQLAKGVTLTGQLLDVDGTPARDKMRLVVTVKQNGRTHNISMGKLSPSYDGFFAFEDVNPNLRAQYFIDVDVRPGYRPVRYEVKKATQPVVIQLERFKHLTGVVIDDATGWPVMGAEVEAIYEENGRRKRLQAEGVTDEHGEFVFSNMAAQQYRLSVLGAALLVQQSTWYVTGGQTAPAVLRIKIHNRNLKPQRPEAVGMNNGESR